MCLVASMIYSHVQLLTMFQKMFFVVTYNWLITFKDSS